MVTQARKVCCGVHLQVLGPENRPGRRGRGPESTCAERWGLGLCVGQRGGVGNGVAPGDQSQGLGTLSSICSRGGYSTAGAQMDRGWGGAVLVMNRARKQVDVFLYLCFLCVTWGWGCLSSQITF